MLHQEAKLRDALFKQESQEQTLLLPSAMQSTSLQGGAGTGKTLTLVKKLVSEASDTSILVITRLPKLVAFMKSEAQQKRNIDNVAFATYEELIRDMTRSIQPSAIRETQSFPAFSRVGFATDTGVCFNEGFVNQFLEPLERKRMEKSSIMAEALWLHIRLIKSSALCATTNMPLTLDQYLSLPTQYGFNREQREVIFTLCKRYQEWLIQESLHDEADRVLYILSACSGGRSLSSSLRDSPFPFDMVMVDEAQDFTELDLSLFIRIASSVRSLFLGSDPAQSVEIGVRMRTGTINRVFNGALAPDGKHLQVKDVLQEISLSTNYRTHAKNVMLAKAIRRVLTRSFGVPGTTENAVMEGPIPRAMHIDSLDELANENTFRGADTVIICPDSVVDEMRTKLAALGVTNDVFGVRETKGLEFTDVLVFGFFMLSEDDCPREWMNALRWMGSSKKITATESSERVKGVALEPCDYSLSHPQLEDQASALYTAITRCKGQLYLCEAASGWGDSNGKTSQKRKGQSLAQFALRHLADLGLVVQVNRIDAGEQVVTPQQHKVRGVQLVVQGIEMSKTSASTGAVRKKFLEAAERFSPEKGNDNHLTFQCMQHMEAITLMRSLRQYAKDKFFVKKKGRYELQGHFAEILQFEKDTCKLLRLAANDSFLWEVVQEHTMLVDEVFFGSPFQVHFCSRGYET